MLKTRDQNHGIQIFSSKLSGDVLYTFIKLSMLTLNIIGPLQETDVPFTLIN